MIVLSKYEEFSPQMGFPSIRKFIQKLPYENQKNVVEYLKSGQIHIATTARIVDALTGETTNQTLVYMNDGKYSWSNRLIYHIEKYNLRLQRDVEEDIIRRRNKMMNNL